MNKVLDKQHPNRKDDIEIYTSKIFFEIFE